MRYQLRLPKGTCTLRGSPGRGGCSFFHAMSTGSRKDAETQSKATTGGAEGTAECVHKVVTLLENGCFCSDCNLEMEFDREQRNWIPKRYYLESAGVRRGAAVPKSLSGALDSQVGGDHYAALAIQPVQYIHANGLGFMEGCVIKYVSRHRRKNGAEDLKKAIHFLRMLLEMDYGEKGEKQHPTSDLRPPTSGGAGEGRAL